MERGLSAFKSLRRKKDAPPTPDVTPDGETHAFSDEKSETQPQNKTINLPKKEKLVQLSEDGEEGEEEEEEEERTKAIKKGKDGLSVDVKEEREGKDVSPTAGQ